MNPKFIIQKGEFRMGRAEMHVDLSSKAIERPIGGGWWHLNREDKIMYLFDKSIDFGSVSSEDVVKSISDDWRMKKRFAGYSVRFSELGKYDGIDKVIRDSKEIHKFEKE